jgi:TPR repeat protein
MTFANMGEGVVKNYVGSYKWLRLAAGQGNKAANHNATVLEKMKSDGAESAAAPAKRMTKCAICGQDAECKNHAHPVRKGQCCDQCYCTVVLPAWLVTLDVDPRIAKALGEFELKGRRRKALGQLRLSPLLIRKSFR